MGNYVIVDRKDEAVLKKLEGKIKNKWQWSWMDKVLATDLSKCLPEIGWKRGILENNFQHFIRKVSALNSGFCESLLGQHFFAELKRTDFFRK